MLVTLSTVTMHVHKPGNCQHLLSRWQLFAFSSRSETMLSFDGIFCVIPSYVRSWAYCECILSYVSISCCPPMYPSSQTDMISGRYLHSDGDLVLAVLRYIIPFSVPTPFRHPLCLPNLRTTWIVQHLMVRVLLIRACVLVTPPVVKVSSIASGYHVCITWWPNLAVPDSPILPPIYLGIPGIYPLSCLNLLWPWVLYRCENWPQVWSLTTNLPSPPICPPPWWGKISAAVGVLVCVDPHIYLACESLTHFWVDLKQFLTALTRIS